MLRDTSAEDPVAEKKWYGYYMAIRASHQPDARNIERALEYHLSEMKAEVTVEVESLGEIIIDEGKPEEIKGLNDGLDHTWEAENDPENG